MQKIVSVSPFRCRMWDMHDRLEHYITEESCRAEIESFMRHGQLVPAIGRPLHADLSCEIELFCGARRLFVARHLNKPLLVELRDLTDREGVVAMDIENRQRKDVSPYERGLSYAQWLRSGHFQSQEEMARALKVSASQVSRLLKLARLPSVVVNAFATPLDICEGWGLELLDALEDRNRREPTLQKARSISAESPRPGARHVFQLLLSASARGRKPKPRGYDEVVKDCAGRPLFRIRQQSMSIAVLMPRDRVSALVLEEIRRALSDLLQAANTKVLGVAASKHEMTEQDGISTAPLSMPGGPAWSGDATLTL